MKKKVAVTGIVLVAIIALPFFLINHYVSYNQTLKSTLISGCLSTVEGEIASLDRYRQIRTSVLFSEFSPSGIESEKIQNEGPKVEEELKKRQPNEILAVVNLEYAEKGLFNLAAKDAIGVPRTEGMLDLLKSNITCTYTLTGPRGDYHFKLTKYYAFNFQDLPVLSYSEKHGLWMESPERQVTLLDKTRLLTERALSTTQEPYLQDIRF